MATAHKHKGKDVKPGDIIESEHRPATFMPDPTDIAKAKQVGPQAVDMEGYDGEWYKQDDPPNKDGDYVPYGKKLYPDDPYGHTVHFKNHDHYWAGTQADAKVLFLTTPPEPPEGAKTKPASEPAAV